MKSLALVAALLFVSPCFATQVSPAPQPTTLTVLNPDGTPARANLTIVSSKPNSHYYFDGHVGPVKPCTNAQGVADLSLPSEPYTLIAYGTHGWVKIPSSSLPIDHQIRLEPWAKLTGTVRLGKTKASHVNVSVRPATEHQSDLEKSRVHFSLTAITDAEGNFTVDRIPPGDIRVGIVFNMTGQPAAAGEPGLPKNAKFLTAKSGELLTVSLGGDGRTVKGHIVLPEGIKAVPEDRFTGMLTYSEPTPEWPMPPEVKYGDAAARQKWREVAEKTPEYKAVYDAKMAAMYKSRQYALNWTSPTTFEVQDVLPGDYEFRHLSMSAGADGKWTHTEIKFVVPPLTGEDDVTSVDLPPIVLHKVRQPATVGQSAPDFTLTTLDNKPITLADFKGKYLLIDTWAVWCGPCIVEMGPLKQLLAEHPEKLAVMGVSCDTSAEEARKYVTRQNLTWTQTWPDPKQRVDFFEAYPARGIPSFYLISPEGTVLARSNEVSDIKKALLKSLSSSQNTP